MTTLKGTNIEIETKGNGRLYYFWQAEGISASGAYKEEDSYLKVRKRFYDRFGSLLPEIHLNKMNSSLSASHWKNHFQVLLKM